MNVEEPEGSVRFAQGIPNSNPRRYGFTKTGILRRNLRLNPTGAAVIRQTPQGWCYYLNGIAQLCAATLDELEMSLDVHQGGRTRRKTRKQKKRGTRRATGGNRF